MFHQLNFDFIYVLLLTTEETEEIEKTESYSKKNYVLPVPNLFPPCQKIIPMELNYKECGQGDPLIILHGLFGTSDNWQTLARKLAKNYSVYILDLRNH